MKSPDINTQKGSKDFVLGAVLVLAGVLFAIRTGTTQQLQRGVSVQMAPTTAAAAMPEADKQDAWIVAITA